MTNKPITPRPKKWRPRGRRKRPSKGKVSVEQKTFLLTSGYYVSPLPPAGNCPFCGQSYLTPVGVKLGDDVFLYWDCPNGCDPHLYREITGVFGPTGNPVPIQPEELKKAGFWVSFCTGLVMPGVSEVT